jgi:hypothetical protein
MSTKHGRVGSRGAHVENAWDETRRGPSTSRSRRPAWRPLHGSRVGGASGGPARGGRSTPRGGVGFSGRWLSTSCGVTCDPACRGRGRGRVDSGRRERGARRTLLRDAPRFDLFSSVVIFLDATGRVAVWVTARPVPSKVQLFHASTCTKATLN